MNAEPDEIDQKIIERLRNNARNTYVEIGKALGISDATVYNRVNRLMKAGIIKRFTVEIDESFLQNKSKGFVQLNVKPGNIDKVSTRLTEIKGIKEIHEVHGMSDIIIKIEAHNLDFLRSIILGIREIPGVIQTEFIPIFKTWKN